MRSGGGAMAARECAEFAVVSMTIGFAIRL
jgi:hypothetical protein